MTSPDGGRGLESGMEWLASRFPAPTARDKMIEQALRDAFADVVKSARRRQRRERIVKVVVFAAFLVFAGIIADALATSGMRAVRGVALGIGIYAASSVVTKVVEVVYKRRAS